MSRQYFSFSFFVRPFWCAHLVVQWSGGGRSTERAEHLEPARRLHVSLCLFFWYHSGQCELMPNYSPGDVAPRPLGRALNELD